MKYDKARFNSCNILLTILMCIAKGSFFIGLVLGGIYTIIGLLHVDWNWDSISVYIVNQLKYNVGDFLWGTLGVAFTFTATVFLFISFREQREQIAKTREESDKVRFETTYFNILSMLKQVQDTINANIATHFKDKGADNIISYYQKLKETYLKQLTSDSALTGIMEKYDPYKANVAETEQLQGAIADFYEKWIAENGCNIGYFYRYIFNAIQFVINDPYNMHDDKATQRYLNLLQAQLSNEELCLLFYNSLSKYGKNKNGELQFHNILDTTQFLENIDSGFLFDRKHYKLYSNTLFKFLSREEVSAKS